ncbi:hypothetical protein HPB50_025139 [Hyalomma asiaticum]|uniref:Uncharacterized protein n=1 Tax=Hyalomma asiaticum TaxID=266040 RepID=A0ACB7SC75_HYAAI|nr:hypothetical protein HPB50_025139 [Hyalomma asiaticum]
MATDYDNETRALGVPQTSGTPFPSAAGDFRPTASVHVATVHTGCLPMGMPSGSYVLPPRCIDQYRNMTVGSPSTPPEYYVARASTRRPPMNRVARYCGCLGVESGPAAASHDRRVHRTISGRHLLLDATGGQNTSSHDLRSNEPRRQPEKLSTKLSYEHPYLHDARRCSVVLVLQRYRLHQVDFPAPKMYR